MSNKNKQQKWNDGKNSNPTSNEFKKPVEKTAPEASSTFGASKKPAWNEKSPSNTPKK